MTDPTPETTPTRDEAVLRYYADTFCELGSHHECCGKLNKDECSGCLARSVLASAPAPASGGVDAVALADLIDSIAKCHSENAMDQAFLDNSDEIAAAVLKLFADRDGEWACTVNRLEDQLASFSPAATPVSEDEPGATVRTIQPLMCEAVIDFIPKQNGHLPFDVGSKLYALAKPASSPAGGDVREAFNEAFELIFEAYSGPADVHTTDTAWALSMSRKITKAYPLLQKVREALSQSTSAGRVGE